MLLLMRKWWPVRSEKLPSESSKAEELREGACASSSSRWLPILPSQAPVSALHRQMVFPLTLHIAWRAGGLAQS